MRWQSTSGLVALAPMLAMTMLATACGSSNSAGSNSAAAGPSSAASTPSALRLVSTAMPDGSTVTQAQVGAIRLPDGTGCDGQSRSPDLAWSGAPAATRSYAVTMFDPDAPRAGGVWHWIVFDIPAGTTALPADLPAGTSLARQARNIAGTAAYLGPCPPAGKPAHRYVVTLDALDVASLNLPDGAANAPVRAAIQAHTLATATLTAHYGR